MLHRLLFSLTLALLLLGTLSSGWVHGRMTNRWGETHAMQVEAERPDLDVGYAWSDGHAWRAERGPRFAFAGLPVLYKVQIAGAARDRRLAPDFDPFQDFLSHFLAEMQPRLVKTSRLYPLAY